MKFKCSPVSTILFALFVLQVGGAPLRILLIVIDGFGWSDVEFHGPKVETPNMDKLASEGVILNNYYVQPICFVCKVVCFIDCFLNEYWVK